jgi:hypothetical protein
MRAGPWVLFALCAGCHTAELAERADAAQGALAPPSDSAAAATSQAAAASCRERIESLRRQPASPGAPRFDERRIEILGRARGEPLVLLREPRLGPDEELTPAAIASRRAFDAAKPGARVGKLVRRHRDDPATLRQLVLREGYVFTDEPLDAHQLVTVLALSDLFTEPEIWLQRGAETRRLRREKQRRETTYRYTDGPLLGRSADLLFGDRVAIDRSALEQPLHRDLTAVADELGFDRARIAHATEDALVVDLRFGADPGPMGGRWIAGVLERAPDDERAAMQLGCLDADGERRAQLEAWRALGAARRKALAEVRSAVTEQLHDALRFDRPEGEEGPDRDGTLRPVWLSAYLQGRSGFQFEEVSYSVFGADGRPTPPQVCVDFVLDTFERAAGTWYRPRGERPGRDIGRIDWSQAGISNRRGVISFGDHAEEHPELFEVRRFQGAERIAFRERARFFEYLRDHADEVQAGDVVAIQGLKRDDRIHQHAILVERTDPLTGFPYGLADQMRRPRRRTWEGIMAEAPARSLFYRIRLRPELWSRMAGEDVVASATP